MGHDSYVTQSQYHVVGIESPHSPGSSICATRQDSRGVWNQLKAWYLFLAHVVAVVLLPISLMLWADGHSFLTGSAPSLFDFSSDLYQTQVTGLISLALVLVRCIAGGCQALLIWRAIPILLEKRGLTLGELSRLGNLRIPTLPRMRHFWWSCWAIIVVSLLWPASFAAPLLNSAIAWIPASRLSHAPISLSTATVQQYADNAQFLYPDVRMITAIRGAAYTGKSPSDAFTAAALAHRRYLPLLSDVPVNSTINLTMPYFDMSVQWVDATSQPLASKAGFSSNSDIADPGMDIRVNGSVQVIRDSPWAAPQNYPTGGDHVVQTTRLIAVKVGTITLDARLEDGTIVNANTSCPQTTPNFGLLPNVVQQSVPITWNGDSNAWAAADCYVLGIAKITAGSYDGRNCGVTFADATSSMVSCPASGAASDDTVRPDWLAATALDFTSNVLKYTVMLNQTQEWTSLGLERYTNRMLHLGFDAAWSSVMHGLSNATEPATAYAAQSVVRCAIDRTRVWIWMAMNAALTLAALLVGLALTRSASKTTRDPTLAALTTDLSDVLHSGRANGLCTAVALNSADSDLPPLRWKDAMDAPAAWTTASATGHCSRRVTFASEHRVGKV